MRTRRWVVGVTVVALMALGCGLDRKHAAARDGAEASGVSASDLGELTEEGSILELLEPEEREAMERTGMSGARPQHAAAPQPEGSTADEAGGVAVSVLSVALSVAAVAAPFFLF